MHAARVVTGLRAAPRGASGLAPRGIRAAMTRAGIPGDISTTSALQDPPRARALFGGGLAGGQAWRSPGDDAAAAEVAAAAAGRLQDSCPAQRGAALEMLTLIARFGPQCAVEAAAVSLQHWDMGARWRSHEYNVAAAALLQRT